MTTTGGDHHDERSSVELSTTSRGPAIGSARGFPITREDVAELFDVLGRGEQAAIVRLSDSLWPDDDDDEFDDDDE